MYRLVVGAGVVLTAVLYLRRLSQLSKHHKSRRRMSFDDEGRAEATYLASRFTKIPQTAPPHPVETGGSYQNIASYGKNIVLAMVGLPGRGKSAISQKLVQYLKFFHGLDAELFNVSEYRRAAQINDDPMAFDPQNEQAMKLLMQHNKDALNDLVQFISSGKERRIGVFDSPNVTRERRQWIIDQLSTVADVEVIFVELSSVSPLIISEHKSRTDRHGSEDTTAYYQRIEYYESIYETLTQEKDGDICFIKVINFGKQIIVNNIDGWLQGRIVQFLMNASHLTRKSIYLTRHGESEYNVMGRVGGDPGLTFLGHAYAVALGEFVNSKVAVDEAGNALPVRLYTSTLRRTHLTVQHIQHPTITLPGGAKWTQMMPTAWNNLDEIHAGMYDCMTYEEIKAMHPKEAAARERDKLKYRYPGGESYLDVIQRLEPVITEIERHREAIIVCSHQGILRMLFAYYTGVLRADAPNIQIKLNHIYKLTPSPYGCIVEVFDLLGAELKDDGQKNL